MDKYTISYSTVIEEAKTSGMLLPEYLRQELPYLWRDAYLKMTLRPTNIVVFTHGTFDYIYDDYATLEATGAVEPDLLTETRLVGAIGMSRLNPKQRDDSRLRGWVGPTGKTFGEGWDKGHFIAHSIGGAIDGLEANVFLQLRSLNRGWSAAGKQYRAMEKYCMAYPDVLCFSRPIYGDPSAKPMWIEFGVLRANDDLWVQCFDNR